MVLPSGNRLILVCLVLVISAHQNLFAADLIDSTVTYVDGVYSINIVMDIKGDLDKTREILLDYDQTTRYNDNIVRAELLYSTPSGKHIGRVEIRDCLLFFCRTLVQVQELEKLASGDVRINILPEQSDYTFGEYLWQLTPGSGGATHLQVSASLAPKITVVPLIGPALIAQKLKKRLIKVMEKLERLSDQDNKQPDD